MPLQSAHAFASHIGHTGKTTLCFQLSCRYATQHPDQSVLVMDFTEEGDLTKRLFGGVDQARQKVEEVFGGIFNLLKDADSRTTGWSTWLWSAELDITQHAVRIADHNPAVPTNLFLVSSGAWPREDKPMESEMRHRLSSKIKETLEQSSTTWKLFCDTDGDRRPSPMTMVAYSLCPFAIVPLHLNKADLDRTETMLSVMHDLRQRGEIKTQVLMVVWNFIKVNSDQPCTHQGRLGELGLELPFTPSKASLDILDACNSRLFAVKKELLGLFVHDEDSEPAFVQSSTAVMRQLADNVLKPSEELGMPFSRMFADLEASGKKSVRFKSGSTEYEAKDTVVRTLEDSMEQLSSKFQAMSL